MSVTSLDTIGEMVNVASNAAEAPFLNAAVQVEAIADGTTTNYYATWPNLDLDGSDLHHLFDIASPQPGVEDRGDVVQNYRGIHEGENRSIIKVHRRLFGDEWVDMAHSRRLLWTVIGGISVQQLSYDDSVFYGYDHIQTETITDRDEALNSLELCVTLMETLELIKRPYRGSDKEAKDATAEFSNILDAFWEKMVAKNMTHHGLTPRYDLRRDRGRAADFSEMLRESLVDASEDEISAMMEYVYNTFVDDEGTTHYVSRSVKPEEQVSLQAMYHQRLPVKLYNDSVYAPGFQRWFESFSGIDHTHFTRIKDTPFEIPERGNSHTVRPVLAWSKTADGERRHIRNPDLPRHLWTKDEGEDGIHYTDTTTGLVMAALALPEIRQAWQRTAQFPGGLVKENKYRVTPGQIEIAMGAAQTPLLTLLSGRAIRASTLIQQLEVFAERAA